MSDETTPDLTALLAEHRDCSMYYEGIWADGEIALLRCSCGWTKNIPIDDDVLPVFPIWERHIAEQITAAGFGPVRAAEAERDAAQGEAARHYINAHEWAERARNAEAALAGLREGIEAALTKWTGCWCGTQMAWDHDPRVQDCPRHGDDYCRDRAKTVAVELRALLAAAPDREEARDE